MSHRFFTFTTLFLTMVACSSFDSGDSRPAADAGVDATTEAGVNERKVGFVQSAFTQEIVNATNGPLHVTLDEATTVGNVAVVVVGSASDAPSHVRLGRTELVRKASAGVHITTTLWVAPVATAESALDVEWDSAGMNPAVLFSEWTGIGSLTASLDNSGPLVAQQGEAMTATLPGNAAYSLILAVGATQSRPLPPTDTHYTVVPHSGDGGNSIFLSLVYTTTKLDSYKVTWTDIGSTGWDTLILGFQ